MRCSLPATSKPDDYIYYVQTTTTTDAVVWVPVDPALKQRVCHPIKQTVKVSTTTSTGFTTTTEYMDKMLVLSEVVCPAPALCSLSMQGS